MATNRTHITLERIRKLQPPAGKQAVYVFDDDPRCLSVRITPAGAKSFIYSGKLNGSPFRVTIGSTEVWNLDDARAEARRLQTLTDQGTDPRLEKAERLATTAAKQEAARHADMPALDVWAAYVEARRARWSDKHLADHGKVSKEGGEPRTRGRRPGESDKTLPGILRPLLLLPLEQIDADRVQSWLHEEAAKRPTHARLAFGLLRAFLNWCSDSPKHRDCTHSDACTARLAKNELPKKAAKNDCMQREQLPAWFGAVRRIGNPVVSAYLQAALLTGARREELALLTWENLDFQWKAINIRDKVDGERIIPLTPYVASLLAPLPRRTMMVDGKQVANPWVFSSPAAESGRLQEPRIGHNKALSAAGLPELSIHGLRRSFGTLAEWVECPAGVSAQIMGHKPSATAEKHYRVRPLDLLRMWHTKIEGWILEQAGIEQPAEDAKPGLRVINA
ncbi:MAG: integrase family protein [Betaproteobacteria bacterium]|nr:integrase family protein [Candidatus Dechloromonas phosphorivorans]